MSDPHRNLGRRRVTGARNRKLGPVYPKRHSVVGSFDANIRHFYKTKGRAIREAVGLAYVLARAEGEGYNTSGFNAHLGQVNRLVKSGYPRPSIKRAIAADKKAKGKGKKR